VYYSEFSLALQLRTKKYKICWTQNLKEGTIGRVKYSPGLKICQGSDVN